MSKQPQTQLRSTLHLKYQARFGLSEVEMRWCERIAALKLQSLTLVIISFYLTRQEKEMQKVITTFPVFLLRVSIKRNGIMFIDTFGNTRDFVPNLCRHVLGFPKYKKANSTLL